MRRATRIALALAATSALAAGCGPTPPQAPLPEAMKLDSALSGIANACGLSYQTTALRHGSLRGLEAVATRESKKLASVYRRNPDWIYQGETIRAILADSVARLSECGLEDAKAELVRQTTHRLSG